jgi:hypothetical protein
MNSFLRFFFSMVLIPGSVLAQCDLVVTPTVTSPNCNGESDGQIELEITSSTPFNTSTKGLLISAVHANPAGNDSPFEFIELIATKAIDFSVTPYTIIWSNNGVATDKGWVQGGIETYAFSITSGVVIAGELIYIGGSSMLPNQFYMINTATTNGDGGIGTAALSGVLGNGGTSCDGVAVFDQDISAIDSSTVPVDAIFFGTAVGSSLVASGAEGYQLPVNDMYTGGKLQTTSFLAPDAVSGQYLIAAGVYDVQSNTFTTARTWNNSTSYSDMVSEVKLSGFYNFSWSNSATSQNLTSIGAGTYSVTVTDGAGCILTPSIVVTQPSAIIAASSQIPANCTATNGKAIIFAAGGTPGYTFNWVPTGSTNDTLSAPPGTYTVTTTDASGCSRTDSITITRISTVILATTQTNVSCNGDSTGTVSVAAVGGTAPYAFTWTPAGSGNSLSNLPAGEYSVAVIDSFGCTASKTITIMQPTAITAGISTTNSLACSCTGSATVTVSGGDAPYAYNWSPLSFTGNSATALCPGTYTVVISDNNGCDVTLTGVVGSISTPINLIGITYAPTCSNSGDGAIHVIASGGSTPYSYAWLPFAGNNDSISNLTPGAYIVTVKDANNCAAVDTFTVPTTQPFTAVDLGADTVVCSVSLLTVCAPSGYTYSWSDASTSSCITPTTTGCYTVDVSNPNGCIVTDSICITVDICTGITESVNTQPLIYPNPANEQLIIQSTDSQPVVIDVFDTRGRILISQRVSGTTKIDISGFDAGIYLIRVGTSVQRVVIE